MRKLLVVFSALAFAGAAGLNAAAAKENGKAPRARPVMPRQLHLHPHHRNMLVGPRGGLYRLPHGWKAK